jgi:gliding motility-associated-like protein
MNRIVSAILFSCIYLNGFGQYVWFNSYAGIHDVDVSGMATDPDNNLFIVGNSESGFNSGKTFLSGPGSCVIKLSPQGTVIWAKPITYNQSAYAAALDVRADGLGNVYVSGQYPQQVTIGHLSVSQPGDFGSYLAKLDGNGNVAWIKNYPLLQNLYQFSVNHAGEVAIAGDIANSPLRSGDLVLYGTGAFGALYDTNGVLVWGRMFSSGEAKSSLPISVALSSNGDYFFCGRYEGLLEIDGKQVSTPGLNRFDTYYAKINRQGQCEWITTAQRTVPASLANSLVLEYGEMTIDESGDLYATGTFFKSMTIGGETLTATYGNRDQSTTMYAARIDDQGNLKWLQDIRPLMEAVTTSENIIVKNAEVFVSGVIDKFPYYAVLNSADGSILEGIAEFDVGFGSIAGGLAVDAELGVYLSGRNVPIDGERSTGYVFKVGDRDAVADAGEVNTLPEYCVNGTIHATTSPVFNATSYEWVVVRGAESYVFVSDGPEIEIPLDQFGPGEISIKVRGVNESGSGKYSGVSTVSILDQNNHPAIAVQCNSLVVVRGGNSVLWYSSTQSVSDEQGLKTYTPPGDGVYYVIEQQVCGPVKSNEINFKPLTASSLFIPNIITPNDDGKNDQWVLDKKITGADISIFSRWGTAVFTALNYQNNWNGGDVSGGVYFYTISHECFPEGITGPITVVK